MGSHYCIACRNTSSGSYTMALNRARADGTRRGGPTVTLREGPRQPHPNQVSWLPEDVRQKIERYRTFSVADMQEARARHHVAQRRQAREAGQLELMPTCWICNQRDTLLPVEVKAGFTACVACHVTLELGTIAIHGWEDVGGPTGRWGDWCSCQLSRCTWPEDMCCIRCRAGISLPPVRYNPNWIR